MTKKQKIERKNLKFKNHNLYLMVSSYLNGRLAILCETKNEPYCDITVNLADVPLMDDSYGFIDELAKDCGLEKALIDNKIISHVLHPVQYNYGRYDLVQFNLEKLKEYDPLGFSAFEELGVEEIAKDFKI